MKRFLLPVLILALSASGTSAAEPPLAPGKPAGLHQAQIQDGTVMLAIAGVALVGIGIALATAGNGSAPPSTTSTTSTTPSP